MLAIARPTHIKSAFITRNRHDFQTTSCNLSHDFSGATQLTLLSLKPRERARFLRNVFCSLPKTWYVMLIFFRIFFYTLGRRRKRSAESNKNYNTRKQKNNLITYSKSVQSECMRWWCLSMRYKSISQFSSSSPPSMDCAWCMSNGDSLRVLWFFVGLPIITYNNITQTSGSHPVRITHSFFISFEVVLASSFCLTRLRR